MNRRLSRMQALGAAGIFGLATLGLRRGARAADAYVMRLGISQPTNSTAAIAAIHLAQAVNRRSRGQLRIEVYPNGQLANDQGTLDGLISGVVDLAGLNSAYLSPFSPQYQVFEMPFLFKNVESAYRVLDGRIGDEFFGQLEPKGILGLGWIATFKELSTTTKAVAVPADMKGLRIRIQSSAVYVATYQALGATPVVIDTSETMLALSQRTVDGLDYNLDAITTGQFYNVVKHVAMTNHFVSLMPLIGSKRKIEALPGGLQKLLREESKAILPFWRSLITKQTAEDIQILRTNGVAFTEVAYPMFRKAVDPVYAMVQAKIGSDLIDRIGRAAGA